MAVGKRVVDFLGKISEDGRFNSDFKSIFMSQENGMIKKVEVKRIGLITNVAVVPHPSGKNMFFMKFSSEEKEKAIKILDSIKDNIVKLIP